MNLTDKIAIYNSDCLTAMKHTPNDWYELAICDVPYGINVGNMAYLKEQNTTVLQKNGTRINGNKNKKPYENKDWDMQIPNQEYFDELQRVSKEQIIFGIDYMNWNNVGSGRIRWDKGVPEGMSFKRFEVAYCSFIDNTIEIPLLWAGMMQAKSLSEPMTQQGNKKLNERRIHPCHKPIMLYKLLLNKFAKPNWSILDTHGGSFSSAIACHEFGCYFDGYEIDTDYYNAAINRFHAATAQTQINF